MAVFFEIILLDRRMVLSFFGNWGSDSEPGGLGAWGDQAASLTAGPHGSHWGGEAIWLEGSQHRSHGEAGERGVSPVGRGWLPQSGAFWRRTFLPRPSALGVPRGVVIREPTVTDSELEGIWEVGARAQVGAWADWR